VQWLFQNGGCKFDYWDCNHVNIDSLSTLIYVFEISVHWRFITPSKIVSRCLPSSLPNVPQFTEHQQKTSELVDAFIVKFLAQLEADMWKSTGESDE